MPTPLPKWTPSQTISSIEKLRKDQRVYYDRGIHFTTEVMGMADKKRISLMVLCFRDDWSIRWFGTGYSVCSKTEYGFESRYHLLLAK